MAGVGESCLLPLGASSSCCSAGWGGPGCLVTGYRAIITDFTGPIEPQEPEPFRNLCQSPERGEVPRILLGFCLKGHKVTFASSTWPSSWSPTQHEGGEARFLVPPHSQEGEEVSLFFLWFSLSDSLAEALRKRDGSTFVMAQGHGEQCWVEVSRPQDLALRSA